MADPRVQCQRSQPRPTWLADGFVSLPPRTLDLPTRTTKAELRAAVDEGYASRTSSYRRSIVTTYDRFLGQMSIGDPVLTTAEGMVHVAESAGPRLGRRRVRPGATEAARSIGSSPVGALPSRTCPEPLPKRLGISGDLVDLAG